jgi:hypothetical protein
MIAARRLIVSSTEKLLGMVVNPFTVFSLNVFPAKDRFKIDFDSVPVARVASLH